MRCVNVQLETLVIHAAKVCSALSFTQCQTLSRRQNGWCGSRACSRGRTRAGGGAAVTEDERGGDARRRRSTGTPQHSWKRAVEVGGRGRLQMGHDAAALDSAPQPCHHCGVVNDWGFWRWRRGGTAVFMEGELLIRSGDGCPAMQCLPAAAQAEPAHRDCHPAAIVVPVCARSADGGHDRHTRGGELHVFVEVGEAGAGTAGVDGPDRYDKLIRCGVFKASVPRITSSGKEEDVPPAGRKRDYCRRAVGPQRWRRPTTRPAPTRRPYPGPVPCAHSLL